jgi:energy-converting hydrogenase Eha subunit C
MRTELGMATNFHVDFYLLAMFAAYFAFGMIIVAVISRRFAQRSLFLGLGAGFYLAAGLAAYFHIGVAANIVGATATGILFLMYLVGRSERRREGTPPTRGGK